MEGESAAGLRSIWGGSGPVMVFPLFQIYIHFFSFLEHKLSLFVCVSTFGSDNTSSVLLLRRLLFKQVVDDASTLSSLRMHSHKWSLPWLLPS